MSSHAYSEDQLVEKPAIGLFATLGWQTVSALEESFGSGGTLGRETKGEGFNGKAMVVSIDKATALRMYDKVTVYWAAETDRVQRELGELTYQLRDGEITPEQAQRDLPRNCARWC